ncbi:PepSY domain-containing protein [Altererythrobacter sp. Root672]|uniref:PepSY domain-containing protein n=1 Tax=Altererythrobacter sp. Root672 TaxID=1736584 RepID=UPI0007010EFF|nr:PepSY domain-containing protein [Altererythrobacter sp. Root672]KRA81242.1 hypothetical protein ASD76_11705 [Altererythrobacter sp. Root672]
MSHQRMMQRFARWHIWLGWAIALPILIWTITGLVMVARPIEEIRGDHLKAGKVAFEPDRLVWPKIGEPLQEAKLVLQPDGPLWIVTATDGRQWRYSATTGTSISPVLRDEARRIADAAFAGDARLEKMTYFPVDEEPLDLRAGRAAWQAHFADGTNVYVDDTTGEVLAFRTGNWRIYDFLWGLHIMDPQTREDTHNPLVIGFGVLSLIGALLGCILLFRRRKARVQTRPALAN